MGMSQITNRINGSSMKINGNSIIKLPGEYYLNEDCTADGNINIQIQANNVFLDLNGKTLGCNTMVSKNTKNYGVLIGSVQDVFICNGKITGCYAGISAANTHNLTLERIDFSGNYYMGANLGGVNSKVRFCTFSDITGYEVEAYSIGLNNIGDAACVENNLFLNLYRQAISTDKLLGEGVGIICKPGSKQSMIRFNYFRNDTPQKGSIGIWLGEDSTNTLVENNAFVNIFQPVAGKAKAEIKGNMMWLNGLYKGSYGIATTGGVASDNLVVGYEVPVTATTESYRNIILNTDYSQ